MKKAFLMCIDSPLTSRFERSGSFRATRQPPSGDENLPTGPRRPSVEMDQALWLEDRARERHCSPALARYTRRGGAWRPARFWSSWERSGEIRGVEDRSNRGSRVGVEVNGERRDHRVAGFKSDKRWNDTARCSTHPIRTLGGHILTHHLGHLRMRDHAQRAGENDCGHGHDCSDQKETQFWFARSSHLVVSLKPCGFLVTR